MLIVGLGNPEGKYFHTWHNLGFLCVDVLAERLGAKMKKKGNQLFGLVPPVNGVELLLLKPLTYMNRSGEAVLAVMRKYKLGVEDVIVFVDDLYIDKGNVRLVQGGSNAGHNGIRSINNLVGDNKYVKVRVGCKPEKPPHSMANYVLSRFPEDELPTVREGVHKAVDAVQMLVDGIALREVQQQFNATNKQEGEE